VSDTLPDPTDDVPVVPQPTEQDRQNARIRQEIAQAQLEAYAQVLKWALGAFGPGWLPSHKHFLLDRDEEARVRYTEERAQAAATVYTAKNSAGQARHFTVDPEGRAKECADYQEGFGAMLFEEHPSQGFEHGGKFCHYYRYSLCWAPFDLYEPMTAEGLAKLRQSRERKRQDRADAKWAADHPLLAWSGLNGREQKEGRDEDGEANT